MSPYRVKADQCLSISLDENAETKLADGKETFCAESLAPGVKKSVEATRGKYEKISQHGSALYFSAEPC